MNGALFDRNRSSPSDQAVARNSSIAANTTGPNAPANLDPEWYKNAFVSKLREQPESKNFFQQAFSADSAAKAQQRIDSFSNAPGFTNPGDQRIAKDFLAKYAMASEKMIPATEMISSATIERFKSQQPGQGIGEGNVTVSRKMDYPGASGTATS